MTKELYDRLTKYRTPYPLTAEEYPLADDGYITLHSIHTDPPEFVLTDKGRMEMSDFEKADQRNREIEERNSEIRRKQDHQNRVVIWLAALTLAATVIFGLIGVLFQLLRS